VKRFSKEPREGAGVTIALDESEMQSVIRLEGVIDISSASELKELLIAVLGAGREVRISLEGASGLDVTAVELLWAAEHEAVKAGIKLSPTAPVPATILASLEEAGLSVFGIVDQAGVASEVAS
jgi:anti-anti-sigma regulatory factor